MTMTIDHGHDDLLPGLEKKLSPSWDLWVGLYTYPSSFVGLGMNAAQRQVSLDL